MSEQGSEPKSLFGLMAISISCWKVKDSKVGMS